MLGCPQEPTTVAGYLLEPGTTILVSPYVIHRDPRRFADPDDFHPERWFPGGKGTEQAHFLAFGYGSLACQGIAWVMAQTTLALAAIVRRWRMTPGPGGYRLRASGDLRPVGLKVQLTPVSQHVDGQ